MSEKTWLETGTAGLRSVPWEQCAAIAVAVVIASVFLLLVVVAALNWEKSNNTWLLALLLSPAGGFVSFISSVVWHILTGAEDVSAEGGEATES